MKFLNNKSKKMMNYVQYQKEIEEKGKHISQLRRQTGEPHGGSVNNYLNQTFTIFDIK